MVDSHGEISAVPHVTRGPQAGLHIQEHGVFTFTVRDADGNVTQTVEAHNALTTVGANDILDKWRSASSGATSLYIGLIASTGFTALASSDTLASHGGWQEADWTATADYARKLWNPSAASSGQMTDASDTFNLAGLSGSNVAVRGAFVTDQATGTVGVLHATSTFTGGSTLTLGNNDTLTISFSITLS